MRTRLTFTTLMLAAGALFGWIVGEGQFNARLHARDDSSGAGRPAPAATPPVQLAQATKKAETAGKDGKKPNILVIFGDDIGTWNVGAYTHGMMGRTPNIDRIAREGILFTDHYAQPSCTAGRAAFIMGQLPVRTGMTTVG